MSVFCFAFLCSSVVLLSPFRAPSFLFPIHLTVDFWSFVYEDARSVPLRVFAPAPPCLTFPSPRRPVSSASSPPAPVRSDECPPPVSCEVHVGPAVPACGECIPGLLVCPSHLVACGAESLTSCTFCLKILCAEHTDCPCADAIERRRLVLAEMQFLSATSVPVLPLVSAGPTTAATHADPAFVSAAPASPISDMLARCLSPGPAYDGPEPDPALMVWPLSAQPDWPISDAFRDFAFETVVLRARSPSPLRECDDSFSAS
jgi:hypothetical protein